MSKLDKLVELDCAKRATASAANITKVANVVIWSIVGFVFVDAVVNPVQFTEEQQATLDALYESQA